MHTQPRRMRWLAAVLGVLLALAVVPAAAALADPADAPEGAVEEQVGVATSETNEAPGATGAEKDEAGAAGVPAGAAEAGQAATPRAEGAVYVGKEGSDTEGNGSEDNPYASLATAVKNAKSGETVYLLTDIDASGLALVDKKDITINGNGHVVTRVEGFTPTNDQGRGGYNPAMIEVANGSTLTLTNITLDDAFRAEAATFSLASGTSGNEQKVHDGIIASYGDGASTIILDNGTTLKNFGGLSAVYITGEGGEGATLIMKSGSKICDDGTGSRKGGYGAIFNHGGTVQTENGSSVESIDGRAIFADNGGVTTFAGTIKNITSSDKVKNAGDAGVAYYGDGKTMFTLASGGVIEDINSHDGTGADSVLHLHGGTFKTEKASEIRNIEIVGIADMDGATVDLAGSITNCNAKDVMFRMRGNAGTFTLEESGSIKSCTCSVALVYLNGGKPTVTIAGNIDGVNEPVLFMSNNGSRKGGSVTLTETGVITNITGYGMRLEDPSNVTIAGTITNCSSYALQYYPKADQSLLTIRSSATIENNNGGKAQVHAQNTLPATDAQEHIVIEPGGLDGNTTIDLSAFDVTLDTDYENIKLGNASSAVASTLKERVLGAHSGWTAACSGAVWMQPSSSEVHFTVPRTSSSSMKNSGLYVTVLELNEDGTVPSGNSFSVSHYVGTGSDDPVDVTIEDLEPGQSYAVMFFNNGEYTLTPDDVTIYTGGGQGDETYDDGGFPKITLLNSIDLSYVRNPETGKNGYDLKSLEVNGQAYTATADESLVEQLVNLLEATYTYEDGMVATNDTKPGEYKVTLAWKDGLTDEDVLVNGNSVALGEGTLIVRYVENVEGATSGKTTHELLETEPTAPVEHAEAIAPSDSKFYTNDDEDREIDAEGVQILDDDLLIDEDGTDRQELLEQKAEEYLGAADEGQVYRYEFHYLDLVDAYNGNAWVSASKGTTVYLPYPEGVTAENAEELGVQVVHFKDLHREYGISGQAEIEQAIEACELETIEVEFDANGIVFEVPREGFSPFAVVWQTEAHTITATAGEGGTISPEGAVTVAEGDDETFTITPDENYVIDAVTVDGVAVDLESVVSEDGTGTYTFANVDGDHTIDVTFRSTLHTVTATAGEGGTITPSGAQTVHEGDDIAFTVTPDEGYVVADVKVDGASVGKVDSYTFSNVTTDHTIEVTFDKEAVTPPAHEHVWSDWKCDGESHWKVCETCGAISEKGVHTYGEWQQVSEATETEKGQWERVCSVCGYVQHGETPVVEPDGSEIPETGDRTSAALPAALAVAGVALVAGTFVLRRRDSR